MKKLELIGKRWFQASAGNTYFSAVANFNGVEIARIDFKYGYGDYWLYALLELVVVEQYQMGDQQPWQFLKFLESQGIATFSSVTDVNRKKDLAL